MKTVLFFLCLFISGCQDHNTLNQIIFKDNNLIKVSINGHIKNPGTYLIEKDSNLNQLIEKAGGYLNNHQKQTNQKLKNNQRIFINSNRIKNKINLNQASSKQLETIKGVGPALAKKIINHRLSIKQFDSIEQLLDIKGIKEKKFKQLYEYFTL